MNKILDLRELSSAAAYDKSHGMVVLYPCATCKQRGHEHQSQSEVAKRLAAIMGYDYGGDFDPACSYDRSLYFVPTDTFISSDSTRPIGIASENDFFGGVVPHPFVATKTITHDLLTDHEYAPAGWSTKFGHLVHGNVLPGFSAFTLSDMRKAANLLLEHGKVRIKKAGSRGGLGQWVVTDAAELDACLAAMDKDELRHDGVVVEANLNDVVTYSVGRVRVGNLLASYCGTQCETTNNHGQEVYGGSSLTVVRGDFDVLRDLDLDAPVRTAIDQARAYHAAALASYPGMLLSRANYDVAQGVDDEGRWHSGVLEQSWRIGGASAAEVAALAAFHADPALTVVRASTTEIYGDNPVVPAGALLHYQGVDEHAGALTKFSLLEEYANT